MLDVFQRHLDDVSATLMKGDFGAYMAMIDLPLVVLTAKETVVVTEIEDVQTGFGKLTAMFEAEHLTDLIRLAHSVSDYGPDLMTGRYETHVLRNGLRVYGPIQSGMALRRSKAGWKATCLIQPAFVEKWPFKAIAQRAKQSAAE